MLKQSTEPESSVDGHVAISRGTLMSTKELGATSLQVDDGQRSETLRAVCQALDLALVDVIEFARLELSS